jgi:hypothetical protein
MTTWMQIQKIVGEALKVAMAAAPPTTRKAAFRIQKLVLVGDGQNDNWTDRQTDRQTTPRIAFSSRLFLSFAMPTHLVG